ncbi:uncharacterized protein LOC124271353 isoform X1 [Haliotis rubra]|uniref:uncharacterized protein LOC124271353 isoform X1 n=1 Tax=Haliotis rubra TaxID=36100 RepID=UPI001EE55116|nr:uncharacterized protein LOC124271353 isoform X1 [Haliotis rubra]
MRFHDTLTAPRQTGTTRDRPRPGQLRVTTPAQDRHVVPTHLKNRLKPQILIDNSSVSRDGEVEMIRLVCLTLLLLDVVSRVETGSSMTEKINDRQQRTLTKLITLNKKAKRWLHHLEKSAGRENDDYTSEREEEMGHRSQRRQSRAEEDEQFEALLGHIFGRT